MPSATSSGSGVVCPSTAVRAPRAESSGCAARPATMAHAATKERRNRISELSYTVPQESALKPVLDRLYSDFNYPDSAADPIQIVRRYERSDDREVVAFCAASLAFGRVASVLQSIERLLKIMGPRPAEYARRFDPA